MKKIILIISFILMAVSSCVIDFYHDAGLRNCTKDTLYIGTSQYDCFDSVSGGMGPLCFIRDSCILSENIHLWKDWDFREEAVFPDSMSSCRDNVLFGCDNDTGYIFIVTRQVAREHPMNEIRSKQLYDKITIIREKRNEGFEIEYMGEKGATICKSDRDDVKLYFTRGKGLRK